MHEAEEKAKESATDLALEWRKALEGGCSNLVNSDNRPNQIELWSGYQARNAVMYIPDGEGSVEEDKPSKPREIVMHFVDFLQLLMVALYIFDDVCQSQMLEWIDRPISDM